MSELNSLLETTKDQNILWYSLLSNKRASRYSISRNPNCPVEILKILSKDKSDFARENVAFNPNSTLEILKFLSKDINLAVRRKVVNHPNCSLDLLEQLSKDKHYLVKYLALKKLYPETYK